jgi:hypothetical protein
MALARTSYSVEVARIGRAICVVDMVEWMLGLAGNG